MSTNQGISEKSLFIDSGTSINFRLPVNRDLVARTKNLMGAVNAPMSRQFIDASAKKYMADHPGTDYLAAVKIVQPNI